MGRTKNGFPQGIIFLTNYYPFHQLCYVYKIFFVSVFNLFFSPSRVSFLYSSIWGLNLFYPFDISCREEAKEIQFHSLKSTSVPTNDVFNDSKRYRQNVF